MLKILFSVPVLFHGLIHLVGFMKAFKLAPVGQLEGDISRPVGIAWLLAALLFLFTVILLHIDREWWWVLAVPALFLSQLLIVLFWQEAKFGTIPNLIVLIAVVIGFSVWHFHLQVNRDIATIFSDITADGQTINAEMVRDLPDPVQRWLHYFGVTLTPVLRQEIQVQCPITKLGGSQL